jgi:hypothetical protein
MAIKLQQTLADITHATTPAKCQHIASPSTKETILMNFDIYHHISEEHIFCVDSEYLMPPFMFCHNIK